jgi:hypothetical protein
MRVNVHSEQREAAAGVSQSTGTDRSPIGPAEPPQTDPDNQQ